MSRRNVNVRVIGAPIPPAHVLKLATAVTPGSKLAGVSQWACTCGAKGEGLNAHKAAHEHAWGGDTWPLDGSAHAEVVSTAL